MSFEEMIADAVRRAIREELPKALAGLRPANEEDPILTSEEAAEVAGLKPRTIAAWCRSGRIDAGAPPYRIRRSALLSALGTRPGASPSPEAAADAALARARRGA